MNTNDLLSIKDFSKFTGIPQSTLRYYDEIGLFSPVLRGDNNYRYYSCPQITTVNLINTLAALDIPRKEIIELANSRTPKSILERFSKQEDLLNEQMRHIYESHSIIHTFRKLIEQGLSANEKEVSICTTDTLPFTMGPKNDFHANEQFYDSFVNHCHYVESIGVSLSYPVGGYYTNLDAYIAMPSQPTNFFSLNPVGKCSKPAGHYLVGYTRGYYGEMGDLPKRLLKYADKHKLSPKGSVYVVYLHDEISMKDCEYLAQVSVALDPPPKSKNRT